MSTLTHLREHDAVLGATLGAADCSSAVALLLLVEPSLQTSLVNPLGTALTPAGAHPLCHTVLFFGGKTHPTVSEKQSCAHTRTHARWRRDVSMFRIDCMHGNTVCTQNSILLLRGLLDAGHV